MATVICNSCDHPTSDFYSTCKGNFCRECYERMAARQQRERVDDKDRSINILAGEFPWYWLENLRRPEKPDRTTGGEAGLREKLNRYFGLVLCTFVLLCNFAYRAACFGQMPIPADNPPNAGKALVGKMLAFDPRLSVNNSTRCMDCHNPANGYTDNKSVSEGILNADGTRRRGTRNSPTLINTGDELAKFWDVVSPNGLEDQAWRPLQNPNEHGQQTPQQVVDRLNRTGYRALFQQLGYPGVTKDGVAACLAQFERQIVCRDTNYARYLAGETTAMTAAEKRGLAVFINRSCIECHAGPDLRDSQVHNIGLEFVSRRGNLTGADRGRAGVTNNPADERAFKTPTLVALAMTQPYMHNGTILSIAECVEFFNQGGVLTTRDGRRLVDGLQDPRIRPLGLSLQEKSDLVTFLTRSTAPHDYPFFTQPTLPQ